MKEGKQEDQTSFIKVLGASPINKVLDFLIENIRTSWSMNEISNNAKVGYSTLKIILPKMIENDLIKVDRKIGKISMYRINVENVIVSEIINLYNLINKKEIEKLI